MLKTVHTFSVWHPEQGLPVVYAEREFEFSYPVSRTYARWSAGTQLFVIEVKPRAKRGIKQRRVKNKVQKVT